MFARFSYIQWCDNTYPSGKKTKMLLLLERCTKAFKDWPQYKNDLRYLKKWIQFVSRATDTEKENV